MGLASGQCTALLLEAATSAASHLRLSRSSTTRDDEKVRNTKLETRERGGGKGKRERGRGMGGWRGAEDRTDSVRRGGGKEKRGGND